MEILIFEIFTLVVSAILVLSLTLVNKKAIQRFGILLFGVLIFEFFTQPLWYNQNLSSWAYIYQDVSWLLTVGWAAILLFAISIIDRFTDMGEARRFFFQLLLSTFLGVIAEGWVLLLGIRAYSPEVLGRLSGIIIPLTNVPIESLYYMPVFMALIISFTRYFEIGFKEMKEKR